MQKVQEILLSYFENRNCITAKQLLRKYTKLVKPNFQISVKICCELNNYVATILNQN